MEDQTGQDQETPVAQSQTAEEPTQTEQVPENVGQTEASLQTAPAGVSDVPTPDQDSEELRTVDAPAPDRAEEKRVDVPQNDSPVTE